MKIAINDERCIVSGMCTSIAPEIFQIGDDGKTKVLIEDLPPELAEKAESAEMCCPTEAILIQSNGE